MVASEICKKYNESNNKREMIKVLADMESCTKEDIIELLEINGCEVVRETRGRKAKAKEDVVPEKKIPVAVANFCYARLEEIESAIRDLENEYKEISDFICGKA